MNIIGFLGGKYRGNLSSADLLFSSRTISNNIHRLANEYRERLRSILIEQAQLGCLCLCPDLWVDRYRKINYLGITAVFVDKNHELVSVDICCCEYDEADKSGSSVLQVNYLTVRIH